MSTANQMVWCVVCLDDKGELVHIFSSREKRDAFMEKDPRDHVAYDYVIDQPERMEQPTQ